MIPHRRRVQALLTKRGRREHRQFLVEGVRLVEEALAAGVRIEWLYHIAPLPQTRLAEVIERARARGIHLSEVSPDELLTLSDTQTPQGVVGLADAPVWSEDDVWRRTEGDALILDGVRDPGNFGTLLRTAEAAGVRCVIATGGCVELTNPKVIRSAMGSAFRMPTVTTNADEVISRCTSVGLPLVLAAVRSGQPVSRLNEYGRIALILGGEASGAEEPWRGRADVVVHVPMAEQTESLNVAVAGGVILFRRVWGEPSGDAS